MNKRKEMTYFEYNGIKCRVYKQSGGWFWDRRKFFMWFVGNPHSAYSSKENCILYAKLELNYELVDK